MGKVIIIGCGKVGLTYAYSLINTKMNISEIILIDRDKEKLIGDYLDLSHSVYYGENKVSIKIGDYSDINGADIICITAGIPQGKNKSRLDDINGTKDIFIDITNNIKKYNFNGIFLIASNPNDVMCYAIYKYLNYDPYKIIGSGVSLDTSRLIDILSKKCNTKVDSISGYVLGEHGKSAFALWNETFIEDKNINNILDNNELDDAIKYVHNVSNEIVKYKNATYYGVSTCLTRITKSILDNQSFIMPLSCYDKTNDVFIGNVAEIDKTGIKRLIEKNLTDNEKELYKNSVNIIKEYNKKL